MLYDLNNNATSKKPTPDCYSSKWSYRTQIRCALGTSCVRVHYCVQLGENHATICFILPSSARHSPKSKKNQYLRHRLSHSNSEALFGLLLPIRSTPALITNCNGTNNQMHALGKDEASLLHFAKTLHKFRRCCSQLE